MDRRLQLALEQGYIYFMEYGQEQVSYGHGLTVAVVESKVCLLNRNNTIYKRFTADEFGTLWSINQGTLK